MVRISEQRLFDSMRQSVMRGQEKSLHAQEQASSGRRVSLPSDDPLAASRGGVLKSGLNTLEAMGDAARSALSEMNSADDALRALDDAMARAREIAVAGASATMTADGRLALAASVDAIRGEVLALANTQIDGVYIFGGYLSGSAPFSSTGVFGGDSGIRQIEIAPNQFVQVNVDAAQLFGTASGQNVFALIDGLSQDLTANNVVGVASALTGFEAVQTQMTQSRGVLGSNVETLERATDLRETRVLSMQQAYSDVMEVDTVESYMQLLQADRAYQAAIAQANRIIQGLERSPIA